MAIANSTGEIRPATTVIAHSSELAARQADELASMAQRLDLSDEVAL